jgi:hypothetical protein
MSPDRQAIVVSFGDNPFWPRVQRARHLATVLEREFDFRVERVPHSGQVVGPFKTTLPRRVGRRALQPLVLDSFEIPARSALRGWKPSGSGALLIGWPFSPISIAAQHLVSAGVPYVVDVGDPWALTDRAPHPRAELPARRRAKKAEAFLWRHAAAGVVTTRTQATDLRAFFPDLELLCRPNGYTTPAEPAVEREPAKDLASAGELRLVHFGSVNYARLAVGEWLSMLREAAGLTSVRFANYGPVDRPELLQTRDPAVVLEFHDPVDWGEACQIARGFDAAVVPANQNPTALPSKAIQYLTLPIPRIAVTASGDRGELGEFAGRRPGFLSVDVDSREDIPRLIAHVRREWSDEELRPPAEDSWAEVAREIAEFAIESWDRALPPSGRGHDEDDGAGTDAALVRALT